MRVYKPVLLGVLLAFLLSGAVPRVSQSARLDAEQKLTAGNGQTPAAGITAPTNTIHLNF